MRSYTLKRLVINGAKSKVWYVVWTEKGRTKRRSSGSEIKAKAERFLETVRAEHGRPKERFTMSDIFDGYEKDRLSDNRNASNLRTSLKPIRAFFGAMTPDLVNQSSIARYKAFRGDKLASCTRELLTLRAALKWAYASEWTDSYRPFKVSANRNPRKRFMTEGEFAKLLNAADTIRLKTFLSIAIATAARSKSIYALKWSDIDFSNRVINFSAGQTNKKSRSVPMTEKLAWSLVGALLMSRGDYVIERNGKPVKSLRAVFSIAVKRSGLVDVTIHDLRRTSASWMLQRGVSLSMVAKVLDDNVEVVERHYGHLASNHIREAMEVL